MKGKIRDTVNKWWVLVLVATLALSLTSCGKKSSSWLTSGNGSECDGELGYFGVSVVPVGRGTFEVRLVVFESDPNYPVTIAIADSNSQAHKVLASDLTLQPDTEYVLGSISQSELDSYDTFSVTPYSGNGSWRNQQVGNLFTECDLPYPY
ncbi:MAG: hypothetical protein ACKN9V_09820 [Pseudomonadota bacterium]